MLAINPRAIADARARDAERAAGRARGPFHGVPIVFKDNIDAVELPSTGGSLALLDHRPRLDSRVAAGMKRGGAVVLGKANLDEFPFGDFGISTVGGTVGNAYDPSLSTAGSSGGSATAVAASLAALGFGTDTCNSLSNPSAFASLATIRTTRGLTSRAGVMPLNTYNDAVGPMAKSVRDVALALDLVTGSDPEDPVTAEAGAHISGSFAQGLDAASLKGKRIGVLRQRFVGFTGEREIAGSMERVIKELQSQGAVVVDVAIADYDAKYAAARGAAPGSLRAGWTAYLSRGAKPGDKVLTIQDLLASGKLAPVSARRLEGALAPAPTGAALDEATRRFVAEPRNVPPDLRRPDGSAEARRDSVPGQPCAPAHARRRTRALRFGTGNVRRERGHRLAASHRAGRLHRRTLSDGHFAAGQDVGRQAPARTGRGLRARDQTSPPADHSVASKGPSPRPGRRSAAEMRDEQIAPLEHGVDLGVGELVADGRLDRHLGQRFELRQQQPIDLRQVLRVRSARSAGGTRG